MNILLDHCLNWRMKRLLPGHAVKSTLEMRWDTFRNRHLLTLAEAELDVFLIVDKGIEYQQNLAKRTIAVITMRGKNKIETHAPLMPQVLALLPTVQPGQVYLVSPEESGGM